MSLLKQLLVIALLFAAHPRAVPEEDPAQLRLQLLREMDARIDAEAARARIEARLMLDRVLPIAFLGMVAEPKGDRLEVTQIYRESGADQAGLRVGDVMLALGGKRLESKAELYREIRRHAPGETIELRVLRADKELVLHPTFGIRWEEDEEDAQQYGDIQPVPFVAAGLPVQFDFEKDKAGELAPGLEQLLGGIGGPPRFVVVRDGATGVLRQEAAEKTGIRYPIALVRGVDADDVRGRIRFRLVGGAQDRAAGILLRYQDPTNYLVARVNAVEGDLRVFRTVNGLRRTLPGGVAEIQIDDDKWHVLEFCVEGPKVTTILDGTITTTSYDTYFLHGRVGVWTKSDSVTEFDEISFSAPGH